MKFTFGIIQIITNTCKVCFCAQFNKKYILTSTQFQYMTFLPNPRGQVCVLIQSVTLHVGLHFFHLNSICNMTTFRKKDDFLTPPQGSLVCVMTEYLLSYCSVLNSL